MDIEIKITCPYCKQDYFINESQFQLGQQAECTVCHHSFVIGEKHININSSSNNNEDNIIVSALEDNQQNENYEKDLNAQYEKQYHDIKTLKKKREKYIYLFIFIVLTIALLIYYLFQKQCTKAELDIVADVQNATGLSIGDVINIKKDIVPHINEQFLFKNWPYERQLYRLKNYKPGSFMNFKYCVVEITPSSFIISGFEFINYDIGFRSLDKNKDDIIDAVKLKYHVKLDNIYHKDFSSARFFGKKYRAIISYNTTNSVGLTSDGKYFKEMNFERLSYHVSDMKLDKIREEEEKNIQNEKRVEELKSKGVLKNTTK